MKAKNFLSVKIYVSKLKWVLNWIFLTWLVMNLFYSKDSEFLTITTFSNVCDKWKILVNILSVKEE